MRTSAFTLTAALVAALSSACSPSSGDPADAGVDAGVSLSPVDMCNRMAEATCGLLQRCWPAFAHDTPDSCAIQEQGRCLDSYTLLKPSFEAGAVEIDVDKVLSCEERMKGSACTPSFPPGYFDIATSPFVDCQITTGLLRGKVASGQTCAQEVECTPGSVCVKPGGVCSGACSQFPQEGDPCGFGCSPGLFCDGKGTSDPIDDVCAKPQGLNATCASSLQCDDDLWCGDDGTCKKRGSDGDACQFDPLRLSTCAPGLACDVLPFVAGAIGTCTAPRTIGSACRYHWSCAAGLVCSGLDLSKFPNAEGMPGTCDSPGAVDADCAYTSWAAYLGEPCAPGLTCTTQNLCETRPALGEECSPLTQSCTGNGVYCKPSQVNPGIGTCAHAAGLNEPCAARLDASRVLQIPCDTGWCDTDSTLLCQPASRALGQECRSDGECLTGRCAVQEDQSLRCAEACQ